MGLMVRMTGVKKRHTCWVLEVESANQYGFQDKSTQRAQMYLMQG